MTPLETLTLAAYFFVLIILAVYGWHRYYLVYLYMRYRDREPKPGPPLDPMPVVTIQLPLFNEMYVADRLIDAVCRIEYPRDLLEIQVLDDSGAKYTKLRPEQYHGSIYDVVACKRGHQNPVGEWNTEEITADGRHIKVMLNGVTIVDADLDDVKDPAKLTKHPGLANKTGHIGFLGHGTQVEFRNIRIRELPAT